MTLIILAGAVAVVAAALVFSPIVQTWWVGRTLARIPDVRASVESVSAGFSHVRLVNVVIKRADFVLTIPTVEADLPVKAAWWDHEVKIRSLTAKDWTLDFTAQAPEVGRAAASAAAANATEPADPVKKAVADFSGLLRAGVLPRDLSVDGADVQGEILLPAANGLPIVRVPVSLKGGGLDAGRSGVFTVEAVAPTSLDVTARGQLTVALGASRRIRSVAFEGRITTGTGPKTEEFEVTARLAGADTTRPEAYALDLRRGNRHLATLDAELTLGPPRLRGKWSLDLTAAELAQYYPAPNPPGLALTGAGNFETDPAFGQVRVTGRAHANPPPASDLATIFDRIGATGVDSEFEFVRTDTTVRFERLSLALNGPRPVATARALQPFEFDAATADLRLTAPDAAWLEGLLTGLPLASLSGLIDGFTFRGGDITGAFTVAKPAANFVARSKSPFAASSVSVNRNGTTVAQDLDLTVDLAVEPSAEGWQFKATPLVIAAAGRRLATFEGTLAPQSHARPRTRLSGKWDADLDVIAAQPLLADLVSGLGRSASGNLTLNAGRTTDIDAAIKLIGHTADRSVGIELRATVDPRGDLTFKAPVVLALGGEPTTVNLSGQVTAVKSGRRLDADVSGVEGDVADLSRLGQALLARGGIRWTEPPQTPTRDHAPFWGDWTGLLRFDFYQLKSGAQEFNAVAATVHLEPGAVRLEDARAVLVPVRVAAKKRDELGQTKAEPPPSRLTAAGVLTFAPADEFPYRLKATATVDSLDATRLFPSGPGAKNPLIEGRFSIATVVTGQGRDLDQLVAGRREEFHVTGKDTVIRLLKANVAAALPEEATPVQDKLAQAGSMVGWVLGMRKGTIDSGRAKLSPAAEAVLDLGYELPEILCDDVSLTAIREADRVILISAFSLRAARVHLSGTGEIGFVEDRPLRALPLRLDL